MGHERAPPVCGKPGGALRARGFIGGVGRPARLPLLRGRIVQDGAEESVIQVAPSMCKHHRWRRIGSEQRAVGPAKPPIHRVRRGHGRKRHKHSVRPPGGDQALGEDQGRLGLSGPGHVLDYNRDRFGGKANSPAQTCNGVGI